ncbi:MAG: LPS-assembly protein LptD [Gammaproteobacteria bacterium]|nr:LPS-assembly protein LptD [Gammaproteobacteria bacterium]MBV9619547.1 LPS-assembly protein LptD [Gammaproteobacteria bacterium]
MLRSSPSWIALALCSSILPAARAADPPCPSQNAAQTPAARAPALTPPARLPPDTPIEVASDKAVLGADGSATLQGNVEVTQGDRSIHAGEVEYSEAERSLRSAGHIDYSDPQLQVSGAGGSYSSQAGAAFHDAHFSLKQRAARGTAREMRLSPLGVLELSDVTFTTCPVNDNSWQLRARDIVLDTRSKVGTGRDARIDFKGVPIVYLPWVSFPLSSERKSGFLFPGIGNTSSGGLQLSVPYYWNIAPNADFTFQPMEYTRRGPDLGGDLRFLSAQQHGELDWNYLPHDGAFGAARERVRLLEVAELPRDVRLTVNAENVSDTHYFEDFSQGIEGASTAFVERRAALSYRSEHWRVDGEAQQYQTIDIANILPQDRPYARVPRLVTVADYSLGSTVMLRYGLDAEVVDFHRSIDLPDTNGWREDLMPRLLVDVTGPGYFVRPALAWRGTFYQLQSTLPGQIERRPERTLPIASFDTGLLFERESGSRNQRRLTLEPRILYLYVPYRDQSQLPVFDTALPDLNPVELFRTNRYVGADRVSDANQVSVGITSRLLDAGAGRQFLAATFGQTYYFTTPRVTLPFETPPTGQRSDFVAQLALSAFQNWGADIGVQWDPQRQRSERTQLNLQYRAAPDAVVNLGYRYQRFQSFPGLQGLQGFDQVEVSGTWPIRRSWNVFLREVYSVRDNTELERFLGFQYRSCCWRVRFGARRFVNSHQFRASQTGLWLQLELAGLAGVGSASDAFLTEEIRGYTPPDALNTRAPGALHNVW